MDKQNRKWLGNLSGVNFEYDERTHELYVNDRKVVTEVDFKIGEKILAWIVAGSVFIQALMSVLTYLNSK